VAREQFVGTTLAGYALRDQIGEGGTATVFRAEHPMHGIVALKVLREKLRLDKTAIARFVREAKYGARVVHPNVVRPIEIGEAAGTGAGGAAAAGGAGGLQFMAIEWANGELLERFAKNNTPLPLDDVVNIISQIAAAVQAAHSAGVIHRDLKPDNVMYDPATRRVKLLDFGIAADTDRASEDRLTRAGFFVGTLMYVAPEALSGEMVTPAADQYSLATIAYYLLCGTHPFVAKSQREMFTQLLSQPPIPLNKARPGLTFKPAVEEVVMRGLSKAPAARYPDVASFAEALRVAAASVVSARASTGDKSSATPASSGGLFGRMAKGLFGKNT
jgi:eukaryotic-like serine/threonine-protein kinase